MMASFKKKLKKETLNREIKEAVKRKIERKSMFGFKVEK